jgi:very-short-patch-repair endonuclease
MSAELAGTRLAARQQGVITTAQLLDAGFSDRVIRARVAGGWLTRVHHGVYRLGVFGGPYAAEAAALLACGPLAAVSHDSVIAMCGLADPPHLVHISGAGAALRSGVRAHRAPLPESDVTTRHGLRVTTPARTMLDVASSMPERALDRLVEEAQVQCLVTRDELVAAVAGGAGRHGVRKLAAVVGSADEPAFTRSEAERRLVELVRAAGLPQPRTNARVAGLEVDAVWTQQRLVVEVDGWTYHRTRAAFERDRSRDARLLIAGYRVYRITWRQLTREPERVIAMLGALLRLGGPS